MINKLLTKFNRNNIPDKADLGEKIGNIGLGLLRIRCGKTLTVAKISSKFAFSKEIYSSYIKVAAVALFIIVFPVTILLAVIGCIGMASSKSHKQMFKAYNQLAPVMPIPPKNNSIIRQVRKIPPTGPLDTINFHTGLSVHGIGKLFSDSEIVEKLDIIKREELGSYYSHSDTIYASYTKHGKAIIQQQATRGCTAATAAMLIMDNGKKPNLEELVSRYLGNDDDQVKDIEAAGLRAVIGSAKTLAELRKVIIKNGSAIVGVVGNLGAHVIIVDKVSKNLSKVRLRDPYHGWEITVTKKAFLKEWDASAPVWGEHVLENGGELIQIS